MNRDDLIQEMIAGGHTKTTIARTLGLSQQRLSQLLNPEKHRARKRLSAAVKSGRIIKPGACDRCGAVARSGPQDWRHPLRLEAHHDNYDEPLIVRWLCPACHSVIHPHSGWNLKTEEIV